MLRVRAITFSLCGSRSHLSPIQSHGTWFHLSSFALPQGAGYCGLAEGLSWLSVAGVAPFQYSLEENLLHGPVMLELSASPIQARWGYRQPPSFHTGKHSPRCCPPGRAAFQPLERFSCCSNNIHRCLSSGFSAGALLFSHTVLTIVGPLPALLLEIFVFLLLLVLAVISSDFPQCCSDTQCIGQARDQVWERETQEHKQTCWSLSLLRI